MFFRNNQNLKLSLPLWALADQPGFKISPSSCNLTQIKQKSWMEGFSLLLASPLLELLLIRELMFWFPATYIFLPACLWYCCLWGSLSSLLASGEHFELLGKGSFCLCCCFCIPSLSTDAREAPECKDAPVLWWKIHTLLPFPPSLTSPWGNPGCCCSYSTLYTKTTEKVLRVPTRFR